MRIETPRLTLESITPLHAGRIVAGEPAPGELWHPEYPLHDELDPLGSLSATADPHPVFTMYVVRTVTDGLAVGGLGFFGPPDEAGAVEVGYGLVESARGVGLATEALLAALSTAAEHRALSASADTEIANLASRRVLEKAGFAESRRDGNTAYFTRSLC